MTYSWAQGRNNEVSTFQSAYYRVVNPGVNRGGTGLRMLLETSGLRGGDVLYHPNIVHCGTTNQVGPTGGTARTWYTPTCCGCHFGFPLLPRIALRRKTRGPLLSLAGTALFIVLAIKNGAADKKIMLGVPKGTTVIRLPTRNFTVRTPTMPTKDTPDFVDAAVPRTTTNRARVFCRVCL